MNAPTIPGRMTAATPEGVGVDMMITVLPVPAAQPTKTITAVAEGVIMTVVATAITIKDTTEEPRMTVATMTAGTKGVQDI